MLIGGACSAIAAVGDGGGGGGGVRGVSHGGPVSPPSLLPSADPSPFPLGALAEVVPLAFPVPLPPLNPPPSGTAAVKCARDRPCKIPPPPTAPQILQSTAQTDLPGVSSVPITQPTTKKHAMQQLTDQDDQQQITTGATYVTDKGEWRDQTGV